MRGAATELLLELLKYRVRSFRNYFNRSIREIAREAAQLEAQRFTHDKPPEPHALNAPLDDPATEAHFGRRRRRI